LGAITKKNKGRLISSPAGVRKTKGKSLNVKVPKHERQTLFTWTTVELKNYERNNRQALVFLNINQLFRGNKQLYNRMPSKNITKKERLGLIPAAHVCRK